MIQAGGRSARKMCLILVVLVLHCYLVGIATGTCNEGEEDCSCLAFAVSEILIYSYIVFREVPGPGRVLSPIGGAPVILNCSVEEEYEIAWTVDTVGRMLDFRSEIQRDVASLMMIGINIVLSLNKTSSMLIISTTERNNGTVCVCTALLRTNTDMVCVSSEVEVILYGPPSSPTNLTARENGVGSIRISWLSLPIENVSVWFTLNTTNLDDTNSESIIISGISQQHYIFTPTGGGNTSCDVYTFQMTALNGAGASDPSASEIITRSLPSLPDTSQVEDSLQHYLVNTEDDLKLNVTFDVSMCISSNIYIYWLHSFIGDY